MKFTRIFFSIAFAFLVLLILSFNINSDFDNYIEAFQYFQINDPSFLESLRGNILANFFWNKLTNFIGIYDPFNKAYLMYFFQGFTHSLLIFNLAGLKIGALLLFTDLQQIDLNQVRLGFSLAIMTIVSRQFLIKRNFESNFQKFLFQTKNFILFIIGFLFHFQSVQLLFLTFISKFKLRYLIIISTLIIASFPLFLKITGITARYINIPVNDNEFLPLNLFLYIPAIIFSILWISGEEGAKILYFNFEKINLLKLDKIKFIKYFSPLFIFCIGFFIISSSPAYQGRIITGLYSIIIYFIAIKKSLKNTTLPLHLILIFLIIGFYRTLTFSGNIYRFL